MRPAIKPIFKVEVVKHRVIKDKDTDPKDLEGKSQKETTMYI